jgi:hypothetical protein
MKGKNSAICLDEHNEEPKRSHYADLWYAELISTLLSVSPPGEPLSPES